MHICLNCGRRQAQREGDTFTCAACGYIWTVEDEQRMAHYLRAQGRLPATAGGVEPAQPAPEEVELNEPAPRRKRA